MAPKNKPIYIFGTTKWSDEQIRDGAVLINLHSVAAVSLRSYTVYTKREVRFIPVAKYEFKLDVANFIFSSILF